MIDHVVLFRPDGQDADRQREAVALLRGLQGLVAGMGELRAGINGAPDKYRRGYQVGMIVTFESRAALRAYNDHPDHVAVVRRLAELTSDLLVLDLEVSCCDACNVVTSPQP